MLKITKGSLLIIMLVVFLIGSMVYAGEPDPRFDPSNFDLGGEIIKVAGYKADGVENYMTEGEGRGRIEWVEEQFNCKLEFVNYGWNEKNEVILSSILAGDPVGDIILSNNRDLTVYAAEGALYPLDNALGEQYYNSLPAYHKNMVELYSGYQNIAYGVSVNDSFKKNMDIGSAQGWFYNRDMFNEEGLTTPNELQENGEWTWDRMKEAAIKLTKDKDGDGQIDQWGVGLRVDPWAVDQELFVYSNNGGIVVEEEGGKVFGLNNSPAIAAFNFMRDLIQVEKIVMVADKFNLRAEFQKGTVAQFRNDLMAVPDDVQNIDFDYGWVFLPKGPAAADYVNPVWGTDVALLPLNTQDPIPVIAVINALFQTTSRYRDIDEYEEDFLEFFMTYVRDRSSLNTIGQMLQKAELWDFIPGSEVDFNSAMVKAVMGDESPQSIMDALEPAAQKDINEVYND